MAADEIARWSATLEGQFFERKSALDRSGPTPKRRDAKAIAWDIVETLVAMANADGGELVVGMENGGEPTGIPHAPDVLAFFRGAPRDRNYVDPPLRVEIREVRTSTGALLLHFATESSIFVHSLADGRYLRRVRDSNMPFRAEEIAAYKNTKLQGMVERTFPPGATLDDLDLALIVSLSPRLGIDAPPLEILRHFGLVEPRGDTAIPTLAALLLFGKEPRRWHPFPGIDFVRWDGPERKHGAEFNAVYRARLEQPLAVLLDRVYDTVRPHIKERQSLQGLFFTERLEYPTFVWQEALVNAVAHRDYSIQGVGVDVWMFDDRIEVRSPGLPPPPATVAALNQRRYVHVSRNPLIVRVLVALGYMQQLGEGVARMFNEMEREGFYPPGFEDLEGFLLLVTLRNQPIYDRGTLEWLRGLEHLALSGDQKRLLVFARANGSQFTSRAYQRLVGLDLYHASQSIRELIRKGAARSTGKGSRVYEVLATPPHAPPAPPELELLLPILREHGMVKNRDVQAALRISRATATRVLESLIADGWLEREGRRRGTRYVLRSVNL